MLINDTDVDGGQSLTAILLAGPSSGTFAFNPNGSFSYTPAADVNGSVSFTYTANDGTADSNVATVTITVDARQRRAGGGRRPAATTEDAGVSGNVLDNDYDPDAGAALSLTA